jgi:very-short-patch-repair endonuclease
MAEHDFKQKPRTHNREEIKERRRKLRRRLTPAEATLWKFIKNSSLEGRKFRRQYSVGSYILDFYCVEESLAVELDGQVHRNPVAEEYDNRRKSFLNRNHIKVIRFENFLVFDDIEHVLAIIQTHFGWKNRASTTPSAEAAATPPIQEGNSRKTF